MVICVGDSLTLGAVGYSYIPFVDKKFNLVNRGVNGDSLYGGYTRLLRYLDKIEYKEADTYIIGLGTNDLLLPFLRGRSKSWKTGVDIKNKSLRFSSDEQVFAELYEKAAAEVISRGYKLILIGLPYIQLPEYPLHKINKYNLCIRRIAAKCNAKYIDIYSVQEKHLQQRKTYPWGKSSINRAVDSLRMALFPKRKDRLSRKRELELTVDGVHYNSVSAKLLGQLVERRLSGDYDT